MMGTTEICGACIGAFQEDLGMIAGDATLEEVGMFLAEMGGDIADHVCDRIEVPGTRCDCACAGATIDLKLARMSGPGS